jgi:hypothetical protein
MSALRPIIEWIAALLLIALICVGAALACVAFLVFVSFDSTKRHIFGEAR